MRLPLIAALCASLCACSTLGPGGGGPLSYAGAGASLAPPTVHLPEEAGAVLSDVVRDRGDRVERRVVLAGTGAHAGENAVTLTIATGGDAGRSLAAPMTEQTLLAETAAALPGLAMAPVGGLRRNANGPYGAALGRDGALACLYAWQSIGDARTGTLLQPARTAQLRLRLCGPQSGEDLLAVMDGLRLGAPTAGLAATGGYAAPIGGADALTVATGGGAGAPAGDPLDLAF